jgi:hypothetical protein
MTDTPTRAVQPSLHRISTDEEHANPSSRQLEVTPPLHHPARQPAVHIIDSQGAGPKALRPLTRSSFARALTPTPIESRQQRSRPRPKRPLTLLTRPRSYRDDLRLCGATGRCVLESQGDTTPLRCTL